MHRLSDANSTDIADAIRLGCRTMQNVFDAADNQVPFFGSTVRPHATLLSYGGPAALPLNRQTVGGPPINFCPHNLREGFHALYALARYRSDKVALGLAERSIPLVKYYRATGYGPALKPALLLCEKTVTEFFLPDGEFDPERFLTHMDNFGADLTFFDPYEWE